jgi:glycosyltransferase involved in cell wall biosynthesis
VLIVIPARDEEARIAACLASLAGQGADAMVVANNTSDTTVERAMRAGAAVIDAVIPTGGVGAARRLGVTVGRRWMDRTRAILTTDADCLLPPDWVAGNLALLDGGAAVVCGEIRPIPEEHAALPAALLRRAALEDRFLDLKAMLTVRLTGRASHDNTPGASLAFAPAAYDAADGFDPIPADEDRTIVERIRAAGLPVAQSRDVYILASCRLEGRAPGGMAAALAYRASHAAAPLCPTMARSSDPAVAEVLRGCGPLAVPADLPRAIAHLRRVLGAASAGPAPLDSMAAAP